MLFCSARQNNPTFILIVGEGGREIHVLANYFALTGIPNWKLLQYHVDFKPDEDNTFIRKGLVKDLGAQLPKRIFDGTTMFTTQRLNTDGTPVVLHTTRRSDDTPIEITIKFRAEVSPSESHYIHFINILHRNVLENLNLQLL